jgi:excisionase family DNA binding protein
MMERGMNDQQRLTISVPEAGKRLGIGRNQAYEAARHGEIPSIRVGKRLLVPIAAFERLLRGERRRVGIGNPDLQGNDLQVASQCSRD